MTGRTRIAIAAIIASCLGSMALLPSYNDLGWMPAAIGAVLVVGVVAETARLLGLPRALAPLLSIAGLAAYLTVAFAHSTARLGFIPGHDARTALTDLIQIGWHDINVLRAPVPSHQGLVLLTAIGAGLVALAVDFIAVTLRRAALAGLPLLALFAVSAATVPGGVGWLPFLYGGLGYLVLLLTDSSERVGRWGQPLGAGAQDDTASAATRPLRAETAPLAAVGRRVGFAALGIAVVLPAAIPGLHPGLFGTQGGSGSSGLGNGKGSTVTTYNPITRIKRQLLSNDNRPLFSYRSSEADPPYFRMTALDRFDGETWTQGDLTAGTEQRVSSGISAPFGLFGDIATQQVQTEVRGSNNFAVPWLPVPYPPTEVSIDGDWRVDATTRAVFSTQQTTKGRDWTVLSLRILPTAEQFEQATADGPPQVADDTVIDPETVPNELVTIARDVTRNEASPFAKAVALQDYFHSSRFRYTTDTADGDSKDVIAKFLADGKGYCVQFSSTMALMARVVGIPARVAIGFTRGALTDGVYEVTTKHAHAWPELYLDGIGWTTFEPTPRGDGQAEPPAYTQAGNGTDGNTADPSTTPAPTQSGAAAGAPLQGKQDRINAADKVAAGPLDDASPTSSPSGGFSAVWLTLLVVLALLLVAPVTGRWLTRRRRWAAAETDAARAHAAWHELGDDVRDLGFSWRTADSPRRAAERLVATTAITEAEPALNRMATAEERALYARTLDGAGDLAADHKEVRRALAARTSRGRRLLAVVLPTSTVTTAVAVTTNVIADVLDWIDVAFAWVGRTLVPRRLRGT